MTKLEFMKAMKKLSAFYSKDMNEEDLSSWYEMFESIGYDTFDKSINEVVKKSRFFPTVADLLESCNNQKCQKRFKLLELMRNNGYFHSEIEYGKATNFIEKGIIPKWLKDDMKEYINTQNKLSNKKVELLN